MRKYNKRNCSSELRAQITDKYGRTISLFGTFAFEWSITVETDGRVIMQTFPKGDIARREFRKYRRK